MKFYLITFSSITPANKIKKIMDSYGHHTSLMHTPTGLSKKGCSYSLKVTHDAAELVLRVCRENNIETFGVYNEVKIGVFEEVEL